MIAAMLSVVFLIVATIIYVRYDERSVNNDELLGLAELRQEKGMERAIEWAITQGYVIDEEWRKMKILERAVAVGSEQEYVDSEFAKLVSEWHVE